MGAFKKVKRMVQGATAAILRKSQMGPVGEAIELLHKTLEESKEKGVYEKSPTLHAIAVLLDHTKECRMALKTAVELVNDFEEQGEWSPGRVDKVVKKIEQFKLQCVGVRLHQKFPDWGKA